LRTDERTFSDYMAMIKRRRKLTAAAGSFVLLAFVLFAYLQTPIYEAIATIDVERPVIPDATVAAYPDQQLIPVTQRVLSQDNVKAVIEKLDLYAPRDNAVIEDLISRFRGDTLVAPSVTSTPTAASRGAVVTYAYTISFRYYDAAKASQVANELANLHVTENSELRSGAATRTTAFLEAEAEKVSKQIAEVQAKIAALISQGGGVIASDDPMVAAQRYEQIDRDLASVDASLRAARERKDVLEAEALQTPKYRAIMTDGQTVMRGEDRLIVAQQELVALQARYSEDHPDIIRLKREIASLTGGPTDYGLIANNLRATISATEQQLQTARESYSDDHPDVVRLKKNLETQQKQLADAMSRSTRPAAPPSPDNPLYLQLQTRIRTAEIEINELSTRRAGLYSRLSQYAYNPQLDAKYAPLARERGLLQEQYESLRQRYTEATLAQSVESEDQGLVLRLAEPARAPTSPVEPNRPVLILLGFMLGIGVAFGIAWLADFLDTTVRGSRDIEALLNVAPIAMIPIIDNPGDIAVRRRNRVVMALIALTIIVLVAVLAR
jgi:succinoglycan biosynthesis transport protein ExoP